MTCVLGKKSKLDFDISYRRWCANFEKKKKEKKKKELVNLIIEAPNTQEKPSPNKNEMNLKNFEKNSLQK